MQSPWECQTSQDQQYQKQEIVIIELERVEIEPTQEEIFVNTQAIHSEFEKELIKIIKMSGYANVSQVYKNFYKESQNPEGIKMLF